jgi:hypothetical protein
MRVRRIWFCTAVLLAPAAAGAGDHRFSAFAAFSRSTGKEKPATVASASGTAFAAPLALSGDGNGWHVTGEVVLTSYLDHKFSFVGDLSGHAREDSSGDDVAQLTALFGFRFQWRKDRSLQPFLQLLPFGFRHSVDAQTSLAATALALGAGVGIDYTPWLDRHLGFRGQADWITPLANDEDTSMRYSIGVVWKVK